jgi:DNA-binding NarL/FixJ family response regulator
MIRIFIVDDYASVRDGVKRIFDEQPGEAAFGEASTVQEALKLVREENWDAVVLDIALGDAMRPITRAAQERSPGEMEKFFTPACPASSERCPA